MTKEKTKSIAQLVVKQIGSPIRRDSKQRLYLKSLGLGKINRTRVLQDTPAVRGLIVKLSHMVVIVQ